jgi:HSP20 family protein
MKLIRYTHPLQSYREWESLFGDPFRLFTPLLASAYSGSRAGASSGRPVSGVEWYEDDTHFHARIEMPGVKREHLRLDAEEGLLRLSHELDEKNSGETRSSRSEFVLRCPEGVRLDGIEARLADGILQVSLPKQETRKAVNIEVR